MLDADKCFFVRSLNRGTMPPPSVNKQRTMLRRRAESDSATTCSVSIPRNDACPQDIPPLVHADWVDNDVSQRQAEIAKLKARLRALGTR